MEIWIGPRPEQVRGLYLGIGRIKGYLICVRCIIFFVQINYGFGHLGLSIRWLG